MTNVAASRAWLLQVFALLTATFAICSAELVVTGVLPALASDLKVDIPTAGQLITGYAIGVGVAGPVLSLLTGRFSRKAVLLAIMLAFVAGNILCALATNYWALLGARMILAGCHGLLFGVAMVIASQVAPPGKQALAISVVIAGVSTATVIGVPLGTAIGNALGWRAPFWIASGLGTLSTLAIFWLIPRTGRETDQKSNIKAELGAAVRPVALICYSVFASLLVAAFLVLSYIVPFLTGISGVPLDLVPLVQFVIGVASFAGGLLGGWLGDLNARVTLLAAFTLLTLGSLGLFLFAANAWLAPVLLSLIWLIAFCTPASLQSRLLREVADAPNFASTVMNSATQVGIATGAALGGLVIASGWSYGQLPLLAALFDFLGLLGVIALVRSDRRPKTAIA